MYIEKIKIDKFRVLEDIEIHFQPPGGATADPETGNVVNVIAGINGTGKTTLLDALFEACDTPAIFMNNQKYGVISLCFENGNCCDGWSEIRKNIELMINDKAVVFSDQAKIISIPAKQSFNYQEKRMLNVNNNQSSWVVSYDELLGDAEFYIKEYILNKERSSSISSPVERTKEAVDSFNSVFSDAKFLIELFDLDPRQFNRPVFGTSMRNVVTIEQLSDGEKQLYGRVIALMILNPNNSIVLIDEPEISLHPAWQQKIMKIYSRIGKNNQFIVATHSPQIIASVPYKNRILLRKENGKIQPVHMNQPPSGVDVNSILSEIMGADPRPPELLKLYAQYRKFVEESKENTPEALAVKAQLSEESDHSRFMQEMAFLIELRDAV